MDIRQLDALVAVVDEGSFTAAARALHTVQSNVSTHIAKLEKELGVQLIERATGALSEEGEAVVDRARRIQAELDAISDDIAAMRDNISGTTRIGIIDSTARWLIPNLLRAMETKHPQVELQMLTATTTSLLPQVVQGKLHSAVVNLPLDDPDISCTELFEEDRLLITPPDHPLAQKSWVSTTELGRHPLLLPPVGTAFRDEIDSELTLKNVKLTTRVEVDGMKMLFALVQEGFGAAILPASAAAEEGDWRRIPIRGLVRRSVGLITSKRVPSSALTRAVHEVILDVVASQGSDQPGVYPS